MRQHPLPHLAKGPCPLSGRAPRGERGSRVPRPQRRKFIQDPEAEFFSMSFVSRLQLDHLVYCVPGDLDDAAAAFEAATGVRPVRGGSHADLGTHNCIVGLDNGAYFEILALDPQQPTPPRTWMAIDEVGPAPRITTFAVGRLHLDAAVSAARSVGYDPGDVQDFERRTTSGQLLRWRLSYRHFYEPLPGSGCAPFLISWDPSCADFVPARVAPPGCELVSLRAEATDVAAAEATLRAVGVDPALLSLTARTDDGLGAVGHSARLIATLRTPKGLVDFG